MNDGPDHASIDAMTPYERAAWERAIAYLHKPEEKRFLPAGARRGISRGADKLSGRLADLPGGAQAREVVTKVFEGTLTLTFLPALRSARPDAVIRRCARTCPDVASLEDVRRLPLEARDRNQPSKTLYAGIAAAQGGATAFAVTGAEVATTVSAGTSAGVAIAAVATDAVASLAIMGRTIGAVATSYGYDVSTPDEEVFAMGVLSLGAAGSTAGKVQALTSLSRLTQSMMRQATWQQLQEHVLVKVLDRVYSQIGTKLTKRKLGQAVPVLGIGINAALTAQMTDQTLRRAQAIYRLRSLSEKYGIDPDEWRANSSSAEPTDSGIDIVDELERAADDLE